MTSKAVILNYGVGNLFSIRHAIEKAGLNAEISSEIQNPTNIDALILPGVGNFKAGAEKLLRIKGWLADLAKSGVVTFGICLGMQLLFRESEESPGLFGLGLLRGKVVKLPRSVKVPHMGWNTLEIIKPSDFLDGISEKDHFYFAHSYYALPEDRSMVAAETDYGVKFPSIVMRDNIFGVQFHPEKSGKAGERIIKNFVRIAKR
ncbi:MAG: imidazole glycerol phosphate synthase subunit HisH [Candidatus Bathyarchaeia archaeon]|nr:imidazole glycerol phosphate synthase subunit HisH [Candidatus Bathyarchaeota archaeon]